MKNLIASILLIGAFSISCSDQCQKNDCSYHGYCFDGTCTCDEGYTGESCHISIRPESVKLDEVSILSFPSTNNGESLDPIGTGGKSDVYFKLYQGERMVYQGEKIEQDLDLGQQKCQEKTSLVLSDYDTEYTLKLYDKDEGAIVDEYMCSLSFRLEDLIKWKKEKLQMENAQIAISMQLSFVY